MNPRGPPLARATHVSDASARSGKARKYPENVNSRESCRRVEFFRPARFRAPARDSDAPLRIRTHVHVRARACMRALPCVSMSEHSLSRSTIATYGEGLLFAVSLFAVFPRPSSWWVEEEREEEKNEEESMAPC